MKHAITGMAAGKCIDVAHCCCKWRLDKPACQQQSLVQHQLPQIVSMTATLLWSLLGTGYSRFQWARQDYLLGLALIHIAHKKRCQANALGSWGHCISRIMSWQQLAAVPAATLRCAPLH